MRSGPLTEDQLFETTLRYGMLLDRITALRKLTAKPESSRSKSACNSVVERLRTVVDEGKTALQSRSSPAAAAQERTERELVVTLVGECRLPESAALLVRVNEISSIGALVSIGMPSAEVVIRSLSEPARSAGGLSVERCLLALQRLATSYRAVAQDRRVSRLVTAALEHPVDVPALEAAMAFADDLDFDDGMALVKRYAQDPSYRLQQVGDARLADRIGQVAAKIMARRIIMTP